MELTPLEIFSEILHHNRLMPLKTSLDSHHDLALNLKFQHPVYHPHQSATLPLTTFLPSTPFLPYDLKALYQYEI